MPNKSLIKALLAWTFFCCLGFWVTSSEAVDQSSVDKRFELFCKEWLQLKKDYAVRKIQYRKVDRGYIAEYDGYSDTFSTVVKVADPVKKVYVGILTYHEVKLKHEGQTRDAAGKGPFDAVNQSRVKEIFMYRNGKWQD